MTEKKKVTVSTIIRTVLLVLALVNQGLTIAGLSPLPIEDETVTQVISLAATIVTALAAWWKNNSFTKAAIAGDKAMAEYRGLKGMAKREG